MFLDLETSPVLSLQRLNLICDTEAVQSCITFCFSPPLSDEVYLSDFCCALFFLSCFFLISAYGFFTYRNMIFYIFIDIFYVFLKYFLNAQYFYTFCITDHIYFSMYNFSVFVDVNVILYLEIKCKCVYRYDSPIYVTKKDILAVI